MSGGNQQKLILARALFRNPDAIIAVQPTRGIDVGATAHVRRELLAHRNRGAAILLVSTELDEILAMADRVAVIFNGRIVGVMRRDDARTEEIGLMMAGKAAAA
jgi:simple sugar transport system ATP-binding protein